MVSTWAQRNNTSRALFWWLFLSSTCCKAWTGDGILIPLPPTLLYKSHRIVPLVAFFSGYCESQESALLLVVSVRCSLHIVGDIHCCSKLTPHFLQPWCEWTPFFISCIQTRSKSSSIKLKWEDGDNCHSWYQPLSLCRVTNVPTSLLLSVSTSIDRD